GDLERELEGLDGGLRVAREPAEAGELRREHREILVRLVVSEDLERAGHPLGGGVDLARVPECGGHLRLHASDRMREILRAEQRDRLLEQRHSCSVATARL